MVLQLLPGRYAGDTDYLSTHSAGYVEGCFVIAGSIQMFFVVIPLVILLLRLQGVSLIHFSTLSHSGHHPPTRPTSDDV